MKFLFNSVYYLYNYYMVYVLVFPHLSYDPSCDHDYVTLSHTLSYVVSPNKNKNKNKNK